MTIESRLWYTELMEYSNVSRREFSVPPLINEVGHRHGRLVVLSRAENDNQGGAQWLCRCDCGRQTIVRGFCLRNGSTISCGCYRREVSRAYRQACVLPEGVASLNMLIKNYKDRARSGKLSWGLTREQFIGLTTQLCTYCGVEPRQRAGMPRLHGQFVYNGIDRIDSSQGYTIENCASCCGQCNRAKYTSSTQEFYAWIERVYNHLCSVGVLDAPTYSDDVIRQRKEG